MKLKRILTSLVVIALIGTYMPQAGYVSAQEETPRPTEPEKACQDKKPDFAMELADLMLKVGSDEIILNSKVYKDSFEKAQEKYHEYAECIFSYAEKTILGTKATNAEEWNNPPSACISQSEMKIIVNYTNPDQMLPPLLETYNEYADYLDKLLGLYTIKGRETGGTEEEPEKLPGLQELLAGVGIASENIRLTKSEKENALVAMDIAFKSLKQLRLAYVMHVQFQCMLKNLEKYRTYFEKIRIIAVNLPGKLKDASMVCK